MSYFIANVFTAVIWYALVGLAFAYLTDRFDHDWFYEQELGACQSSHINHDIHAPIVYVCMYIAFALIWPIVVYVWFKDHFKKGDKDGRASD